jgi:hypothetical protein
MVFDIGIKIKKIAIKLVKKLSMGSQLQKNKDVGFY